MDTNPIDYVARAEELKLVILLFVAITFGSFAYLCRQFAREPDATDTRPEITIR